MTACASPLGCGVAGDAEAGDRSDLFGVAGGDGAGGDGVEQRKRAERPEERFKPSGDTGAEADDRGLSRLVREEVWETTDKLPPLDAAQRQIRSVIAHAQLVVEPRESVDVELTSGCRKSELDKEKEEDVGFGLRKLLHCGWRQRRRRRGGVPPSGE